MGKRKHVNRQQVSNIDPHNMPPGTKVWTYLRHSPGEDQTIESQLDGIESFCREKGWLIQRTFTDRGVSGDAPIEERDGFSEMIYLSKREPREGDLIVIWDYSRFSRDQYLAQFFRADLRYHGWQICSIHEDIPVGEFAQLFEFFIDWKNNQFLNDLRASTKRGLKSLADRGYVATGKVIKGYLVCPEPIGTFKNGKARMGRKAKIDPEVMPLVIRAFELKAEGATHEIIANATGLYTAKSGSWDSMFRTRAYIGEYEFGGQPYTNVYPAAIDRVLFDEVQAKMPARKVNLKSVKNHPRRRAGPLMLANVGVCAFCGARMEAKTTGRHRYYVCNRHNECAESCPQSSLIPADDYEDNVLSLLLTHVLTEDYLTRLLAWTNEHLGDGIEQLQRRYEAKRHELVDAEAAHKRFLLNFGQIKDLMGEMPEKATEILTEQKNLVAQLRGELAQLQDDLKHSHIDVGIEAIRAFVEKGQRLLEQPEPFAVRELIDRLVVRVVMRSDECQIELFFPDCR